MATVELETIASVSTSQNIEATVNEDATGDGTVNNSASTVVEDGTNKYTLSGFDRNGNSEFWVELTFSTENAATTPSLSYLKIPDFVTLTRATSSHSASGGSSVQRLIERNPSVLSHAAAGVTGAIRVVSLRESVNSHSKAGTSATERGGVSKPRDTESFADVFSSFTYNERTSLELIDHGVNWVEGESAWYTDWFQESRILGSEDTLAIRSLVVEDAKEPAAKAILQYSEDGDSVDYESELVELGREEEVHEVSGVPVSESGHYRLKIMEYSGYNSLYVINTAIVH